MAGFWQCQPELERIHYEGMDDVILLDFLPKELGFDMNMHILSFAPCQPRLYRNSRPEHGAYILSGQGFITSTITGSR